MEISGILVSPLLHEEYWRQSPVTLFPNLELKRKKKARPCSTRLPNRKDIKEGKQTNCCGIRKQSGDNQKTCPSKPTRRNIDP